MNYFIGYIFILQPPNQDGVVSLINRTVLDEFVPAMKRPGGVVPWAPPQPNWNPWTNCNIDEGPLAYVRLCCITLYHMTKLVINVI